MPTVYKLLPEKQTFFSGSGTLLSGGKLYAYTAGTTTPKATYTEIDGATTNANPIVLNARGEVPNGVFGTTGAYKLILTDASDATIWTRDNVYGEHDPANLDVSTLTSEWIASGYTPTRTGNTTFTTPGDSTAVFQVGRRLKCTDASTIYATVTAASYNVIDVLTTVTVATDSGNLSASLSRVDVHALSNKSFIASGTAASARTVQAKLRDFVSVKDFGAVGDGVTDDTTAIQAALTAAAGGMLIIPAGTYMVSDDLKVPSNTTVMGMGRGVTTIKRITGSATYVIGNSDRTNGNTHITLRSLTIDGNRSGTSDIPQRWGAYFSRVGYCTFDDVEFRSCDSDGFALEFAYKCTVRGCYATDCNKPGIYLSATDHCSVIGCKVYDQTSASTTAAGFQLSSTWFCTFVGNVAENCPFAGLHMTRDTRHCTIVGNSLDNIDTDDEVMPTGYSTYLATQTRTNGGTANGTTEYAAYDNLIAFNSISYPSGAAGRTGIRMISSHRNSIIGNHISEIPDAGIYLLGSTDCIVANNRIWNVGKNPTIWQVAIAGALRNSVAPNNAYIAHNVIYDTQGTPTSRGIQINDDTTTGVALVGNRVLLSSNALIESSSTAPIMKFDNQFGSAAYMQPVDRLAHVMGTDANSTIPAERACAGIIDVTSTATLTATRNVVLPLTPRQWQVFNNTTGAQSLQFIGATGVGVTVANGKRAIVYSNGVDILRVTADT